MTGSNSQTPSHYRALQGVDHIESAFALLRARRPERGLDRLPYLAVQCVELIYFNVAHLFDRMSALPQTGEAFFLSSLRLLSWTDELLELAFGFARLVGALRGGNAEPREGFQSPAAIQFAQAYDRTQARLLAIASAEPDRFREAIEIGGLSDPLALCIHNLKNIFHLNNVVSDKLAILADREALLRSDELRRAVFEMEGDQDSFLMQFRLLHQIPELCALFISETVSECETDLADRELFGVVEKLDAVNNVFLLVIQCNRPLRNLMLPSEYYRIRHYFGRTSGAQSVAVSKNLLGKSYLRFATLVRELASSTEKPPGIRAVLRATQALGNMIADWRLMHLSFPRNLLGGFGTASLAGSPDGLEATKSMLRAFESKDPLSYPGTKVWPPALPPGAALDEALLKMTALVTQTKYADLQLRSMPDAENFGSHEQIADDFTR